MDKSNGASAKRTAADRKRSGQQRQAAAKKESAARIRSGQKRQAATKKEARSVGRLRRGD